MSETPKTELGQVPRAHSSPMPGSARQSMELRVIPDFNPGPPVTERKRPRRRAAAWLAIMAAGAALAGCAATAPTAAPPPPNYGPYDRETNPYCGATATCQPLNTRPYPLAPWNGSGTY